MHGWSDPTKGGPHGRHRRRRRLRGPVTLAVLVAVVLLTFGVAAAILPPSFAGDGERARAGSGTPGVEVLGVESGIAVVASVPLSAPATPSARPTTVPTQEASPTPRRTRSKSPTPRPAASKSPTSPGSTSSGPVSEVVAVVNRERTAAGCGPVKINDQLAKAAQLHSADQAAGNNMSHTGSDGSDPWQRARRAGYQEAIGENVAAGYRTATAVMDGWMNSPGHRANILKCQAKAIGVGMARASGGSLYWTQMFGSA